MCDFPSLVRKNTEIRKSEIIRSTFNFLGQILALLTDKISMRRIPRAPEILLILSGHDDLNFADLAVTKQFFVSFGMVKFSSV